ncbi:MAG: histidine phosphatase family protein [Clostridia bacterium]|nr:histidine phosphatase family protein [Clostridia bacterium]
MKIYFVRHGHPNYETDRLTELGHKQAAAAAERLLDCGIERVFASSKGRAMQTAVHTAERLGLEVFPCDFMREITWGSCDGEPILAYGHPWTLADMRVSDGETLKDEDWRASDHYTRNVAVASIKTVTEGLDAWLAGLGFVREGEYYRVADEIPYKTVAMFSHGGSSTAALAHLFNIPFPQACAAFHVDFTSVTVVELADASGGLVYPKLRLLDDMLHTKGLEAEHVYGQ